MLLLSAAGRGGGEEWGGGALGEPRDVGARLDWRICLLVWWGRGGSVCSDMEGPPAIMEGSLVARLLDHLRRLSMGPQRHCEGESK